ncbi:MAG: hypothetical protein JW874_14490 [Spirochaetales bacterium]|nr:hypothetical protein [Spirochaetales bacterium]
MNSSRYTIVELMVIPPRTAAASTLSFFISARLLCIILFIPNLFLSLITKGSFSNAIQTATIPVLISASLYVGTIPMYPAIKPPAKRARITVKLSRAFIFPRILLNFPSSPDSSRLS